jgi:hypothetical protein
LKYKSRKKNSETMRRLPSGAQQRGHVGRGLYGRYDDAQAESDEMKKKEERAEIHGEEKKKTNTTKCECRIEKKI